MHLSYRMNTCMYSKYAKIKRTIISFNEWDAVHIKSYEIKLSSSDARMPLYDILLPFNF